jgi:hypothetical protein
VASNNVIRYRWAAFSKHFKTLRRATIHKAFARLQLLLTHYRRRRFYALQKGVKAVAAVLTEGPKNAAFDLLKLVLYADLV